MKKSQLRQIIRESIKELIFEQDRDKTNYTGIDGRSGLTLIPPKSRELQMKEQGYTPCTIGATITLEACPNSYHWTGNYIPGPWYCHCCTINGNTPTQADVGTTVDHGPMNGSHGPNSYKVLSVSPGSPNSWQGNLHSTSACCVPAVQTAQGGCIVPACTHGNTSACASQWFQNPNASWAANWMNNRDCSNYTWPATNLETQALAIMANAPNPQPNIYNDWNDIWGAANAAFPNTTGGPKAQFIGKMAKAKFSQCQKQACNC